MRNLTLLIVIIISSFFLCQSSRSQSATSNSQNTSYTSAIQLYKNKFHNEQNYINGHEYKPYHYPTNENPYLHSTSGIGSIYIDGVEYTNKKILYDIFKDLLVVNPDYYEFANTHIELNKSEIDSFIVKYNNSSYRFINYKKSDKSVGLIPGFYERIYQSENTTLLIKHFVKAGVEDALATYTHKTERYLWHNKQYYNVSAKKKLLALFPNDKKQLKKKIKSIHYSYKKMSTHQLISLTQFIDTL